MPKISLYINLIIPLIEYKFRNIPYALVFLFLLSSCLILKIVLLIFLTLFNNISRQSFGILVSGFKNKSHLPVAFEAPILHAFENP